jgi:hypothetical protein
VQEKDKEDKLIQLKNEFKIDEGDMMMELPDIIDDEEESD